MLLPRGFRHRRWIQGTPDTYRVGSLPLNADVPTFDSVVGDTSGFPIVAHGSSGDVGLAVGALARSSSDLTVVGVAKFPGWFGWPRAEPEIEPRAIAITRAMLEDVGGAPAGPDLVGLHRRVRDAGGRIAVVPVAASSRVRPRRRDVIELPTVVILAAVPMHDIGGGSRATQVSLELLRRGFHVVYVSLFGTDESLDLGLRFIHPELEQYRIDELDVAGLDARARNKQFALLELPAPMLQPHVATLQKLGWDLVYDIIDLWSDPALGGDWYREAVEERLVRAAKLVTASAPDLVDRARRLGVDALLIPNAVNTTVFGREPGPLPHDFPGGDGPVFGYHGSLYGGWFSWTDLSEVALRHPSARIVLIGDVPAAPPAMPPNVHFLGLKPQGSLPDYLARFDVGLLPFVVSPMTHAVSPLKVFEYLACGVPVAAPPLRAVVGIPGVVTAEHLVDAVEEAVTRVPPNRAEALGAHSWEERVGRLLSGLGLMSPGLGTQPKVVTRPAIHHPRGDRRL